MTDKSLNLFKTAKAVSENSNFRVKVGALVVKGKHIVSTGCSSEKTNPTQAKYNRYRYTDCNSLPKVHAEVAALNSLIGKQDVDFSRLTLYVYRELKTGERAMARPCKSCMALCKDLGIKKICYSTPEGYAEEYIK